MRCPECDRDLENVDVQAHLLYHYPERPDRYSAEARKRYDVLQKAADRQRRDKPAADAEED